MYDRYLAFLPDRRGEFERWRRTLAAYAQDSSLTLIERPWLLALASAPPIDVRGSDREALVFGLLVGRGDRVPCSTLDSAELTNSTRPYGDFLAEQYWGSHVAFFTDGERAWVQRAPLGHLACYYVRTGRGILVASDPLLLRDVAVPLGPNWDAIGMQLVVPGIRRRETCLADLNELSGGERLEAGADTKLTTFWSPWKFLESDPVSSNPETAADNLRTVICDAVAAQTSRHATSVLLLSGGLDSSIVAAALTQAGRSWHALNMVTRATVGDERRHARCVADHCGVEVTEIEREWRDVDVTRTLCAGQPYPIEKNFRQATQLAATRLADDIGARAILDGGGGDNIFCALQSAAPLADLLRRKGPGRRAARLMRDIASIAQASHIAIARQAIDRLFWRPPTYRWARDLTFLTSLGTSYATAATDHPWLAAPPGTLPGKAGHVGLLLGALGLVQSPAVTDRVPSRAILLAQPVVEACLAIPTWLWYENGRNRAVARHAFEPLLPREIAWRQSKGAMDSFIVEIFEANRPRLREILADGQLARNGLVDRAALLGAIDAPGPVRGRSFDRIMDFADIEAWLATWS